MSSRFDSSSFADKILAASSLASEGSEGEIEFAFTDRALEDPSIRDRLQSYAEQHSREGFTFDEYLNIKSNHDIRSPGRLPLHRGASTQPLEEKARTLLVHLSAMGNPEELVQYVLVRVAPRQSRTFYTQSEEAKTMDPSLKERLSQLESKWAELPEFGRQLLTITFLIENDNSYEIEVEKAEGPLTGKEARAREIADLAFQSRLKLVRKFTR